MFLEKVVIPGIDFIDQFQPYGSLRWASSKIFQFSPFFNYSRNLPFKFLPAKNEYKKPIFLQTIRKKQ
jgi:hypothetical protein